jgi:hypothetical protein
MAENAYTLRVPLSREQWILIVSNKEMTSASFDRLGQWLSLQREDILLDAPAGEAGTAETVEQGSVHEHAAAEGGDAQPSSGDQPQ